MNSGTLPPSLSILVLFSSSRPPPLTPILLTQVIRRIWSKVSGEITSHYSVRNGLPLKDSCKVQYLAQRHKSLFIKEQEGLLLVWSEAGGFLNEGGEAEQSILEHIILPLRYFSAQAGDSNSPSPGFLI